MIGDREVEDAMSENSSRASYASIGGKARVDFSGQLLVNASSSSPTLRVEVVSRPRRCPFIASFLLPNIRNYNDHHCHETPISQSEVRPSFNRTGCVSFVRREPFPYPRLCSPSQLSKEALGALGKERVAQVGAAPHEASRTKLSRVCRYIFDRGEEDL
eukprot:6190520-Pleurochrysis_carterae.AAC.1